MKAYRLEKYVTFTGLNGKQYKAPVADYGHLPESDVALVVRGYKANRTNETTVTYTRKGCQFIYIAVEA